MRVHQLSVFIENKSGTLIKILDILKAENIQLIAVAIADTSEYGLCRIICCEPLRAHKVLKMAGIAVSLSEVFAIELDHTPGSAADVIKLFSEENISIAYLYSFVLNGRGILIFRTDDPFRAEVIAKSKRLKYLVDNELQSLIMSNN